MGPPMVLLRKRAAVCVRPMGRKTGVSDAVPTSFSPKPHSASATNSKSSL